MGGTLRWGILGAAKIAREQVGPAMMRAEGAELVALATRDPARAAAFAQFAPGLRVFGGYEALLADPQVDAVYIPLPNALHVGWTRRCLEAGKHVLCEKPLALRAAEIDGLIAARDASGLVAAEAFMVCHHPQWLRVKDLLAEGAIGELEHVEAAFCFRNTDPGNIRNQPALGGGAMRDVGVYPCLVTRFVTGAEPGRIRADLRFEAGVDVFGRVWADFPGFTLGFYCGIRQAPRQGIVFHGTEGTIELTTPFNAGVSGEAVVILRQGYSRTVIERFEPVDQYRLMIEAFTRSVRDGAAFACPLEMSRGNQAMIDAIFAAAGPQTAIGR
ncbi:MAG: Gfo/Idh/MocA family oxidoreductase [Pararhodobacter sp.]|nr:Gfo/Idh/MocA family oxidoreductase [Pararhodobacter sp.]